MNNSELQLFLRDLWHQGIELWLETGQLRFRGNKEALTSDHLSLLRLHKIEIIALLTERPDAYLGFPLSQGQKAIHLQQTMAPGSSAYHLSALLELVDGIDVDNLTKSLDVVLQRHAPLRMGIKTLDGELAQQVSYSLPSILTIENTDKIDDLALWAKQHAEQPFDLESDALIRAVLLKTGDKRAQLLVIVHHIVADFWALTLLLDELQKVYAAITAKTSPNLPAIGKIYKDYVINEAQWLSSKDSLDAKNYWHKQLTPRPKVLQLNTDFPRPLHSGFQGNEINLDINPTLTDKINQQARAAGTSAFVWVLSCYQLLLHFYSGESHFAIGSPLTGRMDSDFQKIAGQFTNPVCFLSDFNEILPFSALLQSNKTQLQQAFIHQRYPLQRLIEELNPARDNNHNPLFQYAFSWNQMKLQSQSGELIQDIISMNQLGSIYDLVLTGFDKGHTISLQCRYNTELFKASTIERFNQHLLSIIEQSVEQPQRAIAEFSVITQAERQLINKVNHNQDALPEPCHLIGQFNKTVQQHGAVTAFTDGNTSISYQALDARANQMAHWLQQQGVQRQDKVALILPRGLNILTAILACLKLNAVYVPIDPTYPDTRINNMLSLAQCKLTLCSDVNQTQANNDYIVLSDALVIIEQQPSKRIIDDSVPLAEEDSACILFTSGSTGQPKGVDIPHRALVRLGMHNGFVDINPTQKLGYAANVAFDACNIELWNALLNGGTLVFIDDDTLLNPPSLSAFLQAHPLDALFLTAALFNLMINYQSDIFSGINTLMTGGEAMDIRAADKYLKSPNHGQLYNLYGPTENGTVSSYQNIDETCIAQYPLPIGRAVNQSQLYILNQYQQLCPIGVVGEIIVGGEGIAKGYINTDLTSEAFIEDHYRHQGLLYRTGDLGYLNDQGQVIYSGRKDDQLKIRGFRIELGEIEFHLSHYAGMQQTAVLCRNTDQSEQQICVYFSNENNVELPALKKHLKDLLPAYMLPKAILQMDALPLTPNGKVDKQALPEISQPVTHKRAPRHQRDQDIVNIWRGVLGLDEISIDDDFFELGGHSLLAAKCAAIIQDSLNLSVKMRDLFDCPTVALLADHLENNHATDILPAITPCTEDTLIPASLSQHRLWFLQQMNPKSSAYNMPLALRFKQNTSHKKVEQALLTLISRYQSLHCHFKDQQGNPFLAIQPDTDWFLPFLDLSQMSEQEKAQESKHQLSLITKHSFNLNNGPLIKALFIKRSDNDYVLALVLHHVVIDGTSVNILLQNLGQLLIDEKPLSPEKLPLDYRDYSHWQHQWQRSSEYHAQLAFWKQYLESAPLLLNLPTDHPRPIKPSYQGASVQFTVPPAIADNIQRLAQRNNASLFTVLMSAYAILLSRYCRQSDVCIGFPVAGRQHQATQDMVGLFVNNLVTRSQITDQLSVREFIQQQRESLLNVMSHQDVPFDAIIEQLNIDRSTAHIPFLQASMQLETETMEERVLQLMGPDITLESMPINTAKYDLNVCCTTTNQGLEVAIEFATDLFEHSSIERMGQHFLALLNAMADDDSKDIAELQMISPAEEAELTQLADSDQEQNPQQNAVEWFHSICSTFPEKPAINDQNQQLSYQQLNAKSNQLAHYLSDKGIASGDFVGISMHRSTDLIVAILAVLKTGAAYIPLDPLSPKERTDFIIEDAGIRYVISDIDTPPDSAETISIADIQQALTQDSELDLNHYISNDAIAYVIYTSGTTGKPKGCLVSHANLTRLFTASQSVFEFTDQDVWCLFHSYAFDFSVWEIFGALFHGAKLAIVPKATAMASDAFYAFVEQEKVTVLNQTPSAFSQFIAIDQLTPKPLALRHVIFGGEALDFSALNVWTEAHPLDQIQLTNMYGITETTVHVTHHRIQENDLLKNQSIIGQPLEDMMIHLVDHHGQLAPQGITGEICISGAGVSQGYLGRDSLTKTHFIDNPFNRSNTTRHQTLYRSGDLARRRGNGDIEYLGRLDHQVKIRGYRIELGEIESALSQCTDVLESHVIVTDGEAEKQLLAYCLVQSPSSALKTSIRTLLKTRLPEYMIPQAIIYLEQWPLTANGKIDSHQLPKPDISDFATSSYCAPRNETEEVLVNIWQSVLSLQQIGIHDNFFELGGHSLLATQVNAQIKNQLQCQLELKSIFEHPTIAMLALHILEQEIEQQDVDEDELLALLDELEAE